MEEEKIEDVPVGNDAMEVYDNDSCFSEDSSGFGNTCLNKVFVMLKL